MQKSSHLKKFITRDMIYNGAIADEVTKVHAICVKCGALAYVSHRLIDDDRRVMLGEQQEYEPLCRECYKKATQEEVNTKV